MSEKEGCDVCLAQGLDSHFLNGKKHSLRRNILYKVLVGKSATIKLCHVHDIELFHLGEKRFVTEHVEMLRTLVNREPH
ncbi:MAG: hypothetical protein AABY86_13535 [Bdellovibrionota bacterium]